jgi:hypothetical protein
MFGSIRIVKSNRTSKDRAGQKSNLFSNSNLKKKKKKKGRDNVSAENGKQKEVRALHSAPKKCLLTRTIPPPPRTEILCSIARQTPTTNETHV